MNGLLFTDDLSMFDDDLSPSPDDKVLHGCLCFDSSSDKHFKVDSNLNVSDTNLCPAVVGKPES